MTDRTCQTLETGWSPNAAGQTLGFEAEGKELSVDLTRLADGPQVLTNPCGRAEEMGAVLEGRFALQSGEDAYELEAGKGALIPQGAERVWRMLSPEGALYRVWRAEDA
jgi:hypothetical protein